jgi:glutaredoxin
MLKHSLILYGRDDCHLCEQMLDELKAFKITHARVLDLEIAYINIDKHSHLLERYNHRIPLLIDENHHTIKELCEYFFDGDVLMKYFSITD